jgi:hypothetical protein
MNARAWTVGVLGIAVGCVPDLREGAGGPAGGKPVDTASGDGTGGSADGGSADGGSADGGSADGGSADGGSADGGGTGTDTGGTGGGTGTDTGGTGGGTGTDTGGTGGDTGSTDPCTVALPFDTVVVETASVIADANASVLVCSGATASITGSGAVIVVEARGTAVLGGSDARAWVLNRGTVQGLSAPGVVAAEPSATVNDTLGVLTEVACPAITVDTSALPSGC